jgi:aminopeptidase N
MPPLSRAEAVARAGLIEVSAYDLFLDLTAEPVTSRTEVRFRCRRPGEGTFADLGLAKVTNVVLNGGPAGPDGPGGPYGSPDGQPDDGRLWLTGLDADNLLIVEGEVADDAFSRFTDPEIAAADDGVTGMLRVTVAAEAATMRRVLRARSVEPA